MPYLGPRSWFTAGKSIVRARAALAGPGLAPACPFWAQGPLAGSSQSLSKWRELPALSTERLSLTLRKRRTSSFKLRG